MPTLANVAAALRRYNGRYQYLDAFADDVEELRSQNINRVPSVQIDGEVTVQVNGERLSLRLFPEQGIARFRLAEQPPQRGNDSVAAGATLGALLGTAVTAASNKKEGLLGGLVVGMLVGGLVGAAAAPLERVLALRFDPATGSWQVYDGPLLRWAKRTLQPAALQGV